ADPVRGADRRRALSGLHALSMIPKSMSSTPIGDGYRFSDKIMLKQDVLTFAVGPQGLLRAALRRGLCRHDDLLVLRHFHRSRHQRHLPIIAMELNEFTNDL